MELLQPSTPRPDRRVPPSLVQVALAVCLLLTLLVDVPLATAQEGLPRPCVDDPLHRQLDFWVGSWRVVGRDGQAVGRSRVRELHGGCVIEENWSSEGSGLTGQSLNYVDPGDGRWHQIWGDSSGTVVRYEGELRGGAMHFAGENVRTDGKVVRARSMLEPVAEGRLHHRIEHSDDGGETWRVVFDATYVPMTDPAEAPGEDPRSSAEEALPQLVPKPVRKPAGPPEVQSERAPERDSEPRTAPGEASESIPEPVDRPAEPSTRSGKVRATSDVVSDDELPVQERSQIFLESPMILEVPVGPIESIPEEYSWSSDATAVYVSEGASVQKVTLSRDERRGRVDVEVVAALRASGFLQHVDLAAELVWQGEVLASASLDHIAVGRSVKAQAERDGLEKSLTLTLGRDRFDEVFGGQEERPILRLTVGVRD